MIPLKKLYDAGELYGGKLRGLMACTRSHRWYNSMAPSLVTTDPKQVTCRKCQNRMGT